MITLTIAELESAAGIDLGTGPWHRVEQEQIDKFADATGDHSWLHVDPERAASGPFGRTVVHGYAQVTMLPSLLAEMLTVSDMQGRVNYGIDRLRFIAPLPSGADIRLRAVVVGSERRSAGLVYRSSVALELRDAERPTMVGEILLLVF